MGSSETIRSPRGESLPRENIVQKKYSLIQRAEFRVRTSPEVRELAPETYKNIYIFIRKYIYLLGTQFITQTISELARIY
jgi:hypothetical protein